MDSRPFEIGAKFVDKFSGEVATVCGFRKRGAGWQVCYTTPSLNGQYNFRQSWTQFKRNYAPAQ